MARGRKPALTLDEQLEKNNRRNREHGIKSKRAEKCKKGLRRTDPNEPFG